MVIKMIEQKINDFLEDSGQQIPPDELIELMVSLLSEAQSEIERLRKAETAISQLESLKYFDDWIKLADSWIESPETDFKAFLNNFMESNDIENPTQVIF